MQSKWNWLHTHLDELTRYWTIYENLREIYNVLTSQILTIKFVNSKPMYKKQSRRKYRVKVLQRQARHPSAGSVWGRGGKNHSVMQPGVRNEMSLQRRVCAPQRPEKKRSVNLDSRPSSADSETPGSLTDFLCLSFIIWIMGIWASNLQGTERGKWESMVKVTCQKAITTIYM